MAWYSILPPQLIQVESWAFLLGLITILPWFALIVFDAGLWLYRIIHWELPWIGGRARGQQRPRAPSLNERPDGQRRAFGLRGVETDTSDRDHGQESTDDMTHDKTSRGERDMGKEDMAPSTDGSVHSDANGVMKHRGGRS
ncbi:hypothetical protein N7478_003319 [Penicillium angulare]|uniref:uncharacterized protein n=1 Tax=Penicillium angulare TaxID=116970 RepID=UPI002541013F|nr:uncharacterized protein N7478_003319 [Penicillium angulare]KAJ5287633.1 hypothetical protein N7478_003319 [Penicillium angulare]